MTPEKTLHRIASELLLSNEQVTAISNFLSEGATVPFIACYRKDATGGLDEAAVERVADALRHEQDLEQRRRNLVDALAKQGRLNDSVRDQIDACEDRFDLEDLAAGLRKPRNAKAAIAIEKGLQPLADYLFHQALLNYTVPLFAETFVSAEKQVSSVEEALEGAQHILADRIAGSADARGMIRNHMLSEGKLKAAATKNTDGKKTKYEAYYKFCEPALKVTAYKFFAIHRGAEEGMLRVELDVNDAAMIDAVASRFVKEPGSPFEPIIRAAITDAYNRTLRPAMEKEVMTYLRRRAEDESLAIIRANARDLLLSPYAGDVPVLGIDPSGKAVWKLAAVGPSGEVVETAAFAANPVEGVEPPAAVLGALLSRHSIHAIAIGHGGNGREIQSKLRAMLREIHRRDVHAVIVNDAGASAYSNSKTAKETFPALDNGTRVAITIARRYQDPLSELVKMDPRHIGFGQFHHEVSQGRLRQGIERTIVSVVSSSGVDINKADAELLSWVSGLNGNIARSIVKMRESIGAFATLDQLRGVEGITDRVFQQCAGFLRIPHGEHVLDRTMIHPEAYPVVHQIAAALGAAPGELASRAEELSSLDLSPYASGFIGPLALEDIRRQLVQPFREPRTHFRPPKHADGISTVADLHVGLETEGIVSNVTDFGAFVDIGVEQDGLVHISQMPARNSESGRVTLRVGEVVRVRIVKVDKETPRISLTMRMPPRSKDRQAPRRRERTVVAAAEPAAGAEQLSAEQRARRPRRDGAQPDQEQRGRRPRPERATKDANGRREDSESRRPPRRDKPRRERSDKPLVQVSGKDDGSPLNTLLADQLSALRDKLQSGG